MRALNLDLLVASKLVGHRMLGYLNYGGDISAEFYDCELAKGAGSSHRLTNEVIVLVGPDASSSEVIETLTELARLVAENGLAKEPDLYMRPV